ncbi:hypothetical protein N9N28_03715 [Rubripirellula amarantea]|nr:hypothetical protein [Rubripirellula amarantea]
MDQVKEQLAIVLKYGFWIGCSFVLLLSSYFWYSATSALDQERVSQTRKIEGAISEVASVEAKLSTHPNAVSHAQMQDLIARRQDDVLESWDNLFERQQEILTWPTEELKEDFTSKFMINGKAKVPIEVYVDFPTPASQEIVATLRSRYARYIENVLPDIAKIGGTEWTASFKSAAAMGMGGPPGMQSTFNRPTVDITGAKGGPLVKWDESSQSGLLSDLFPWRATGLPSTLNIYYSQENLWIWRQMMEIIATVNGAAQQPYQAKIHEINRLSIGSSVQFVAGSIASPGQAGMGMGMGGDMGQMAAQQAEMAAMMGSMGGAGYGGPGSSRTKSQGNDPADDRYVDESKKPIKGSTLRKALKSNQPTDVALAVAKRIPVMMSLKMNQRSVPELLAACGSAKLMIEVEQVRILPKSGASEASGGGMGSMMGGGGPPMDDGMGMGMGMGPMMGGGTAASTKPADEFPLDMTVEIYGLIYIYNPMNREQLGLEKITEKTVDKVVATISGDGEAKEERDEPVADQNDVLPTPDAAPANGAAPADGGAPVEGGAPGVGQPEIDPGTGPAADPAGEAPAEPAVDSAPVTGSPATDPPDRAVSWLNSDTRWRKYQGDASRHFTPSHFADRKLLVS